MFFFLSKLLDVFLSPYTWGLLLLGAAVPWSVRAARRWRRRRIYGATGLALLLLCSLHPIANAIGYELEHSSTSTYRTDVTYDAVILLGGIVDEDVGAATNLPSLNDNVERLVVTYQLLRDDKARVVIISSGTINKKLAAYSETAVLARQLEGWGIAKERIIIEDRALNTRDNAVYSQQIARERGLERVVIVTSAFHMPRAAECFAAVGMTVDTLSVDYRAHPVAVGQLADWLPRSRELATTSGLLRELFGRLVYRAQGYGKRAP